MPKVTVIMNCYNSAEHLREAMDSVFGHVGGLEIVFWDNCSTDESPAIAQSYGPKVRYFLGREKRPPRCGAQPRHRPGGEGDLLAFLDCDDVWLPTKLERQVALSTLIRRWGRCARIPKCSGRRARSRAVRVRRTLARGMVFREVMTLGKGDFQVLRDRHAGQSGLRVRRVAQRRRGGRTPLIASPRRGSSLRGRGADPLARARR